MLRAQPGPFWYLLSPPRKVETALLGFGNGVFPHRPDRAYALALVQMSSLWWPLRRWPQRLHDDEAPTDDAIARHSSVRTSGSESCLGYCGRRDARMSVKPTADSRRPRYPRPRPPRSRGDPFCSILDDANSDWNANPCAMRQTLARIDEPRPQASRHGQPLQVTGTRNGSPLEASPQNPKSSDQIRSRVAALIRPSRLFSSGLLGNHCLAQFFFSIRLRQYPI